MSTWIFGYGSLVWRPDFPFAQRRPAAIDGWTRRFWQASPDHRGIPGAPGRVVTLVPDPQARTVGVAYQVAPEHVTEVLARLDHREQAGYAHHRVPMVLDREVVEGLVYVATPENPNFIGPAPLDEMARHIVRSVGPSGTNIEYVLRLAEAIRSLDADDPDLFALEAAILKLTADS